MRRARVTKHEFVQSNECETVYEDGRIVRADDGTVRNAGPVDLDAIRKARAARGWVVIAETP